MREKSKIKKARPVGRPKLPKGSIKGNVLRMRLDDADLQLFTKAAEANGQKLSQWVRNALRAAAQNSLL